MRPTQSSADARRRLRRMLIRCGLAAAAVTTLSGCYVYPYGGYGYGYGGGGYGYGGPGYYQRPVVVAPGYYRPY